MRKPVKATRQVEVAGWDCGGGHLHRTETAAVACIAKQERTPQKHRRWDNASLIKILSAHRAGVSTSDLGREHGVSRERMYQLVRKAESRERLGRLWHDPNQPLGIGP